MSRSADITLEAVRRLVGRDSGLRGLLPITYQYALYRSLAEVWPGKDLRVLDIGCGVGRVASGYCQLLGTRFVVGVDVSKRFGAEVTIPCLQFDGVRLPFCDGAFDAVTLVNVLHHVASDVRIPLLRECRRVVAGGPVIIKDHVVRQRGDRMRLLLLDIMGNLPSGGMVKADYLTDDEMQSLLQRVGYDRRRTLSGEFRRGIMSIAFPNRLEKTEVYVSGTERLPDTEAVARDR